MNTGGINLDANVYPEGDSKDIYNPKFIVKGKSMGDNMLKLMELISELITESKIDDAKRIKELLQQFKSRIEMSIFNRGNAVSVARVASYFSPSAKYMEKLRGLDYYWFISDILNKFDDEKDEILSNLNKVYNTIQEMNFG